MELQEKIKSVFPHQVVRKGISNGLKTSIKLPVYVLEYLISQYSDQGLSDEEVIEAAKLANAIEPTIVVPIHYGKIAGTVQDAKNFKCLLNNKIDCKIMIWFGGVFYDI